MIVFDVKFIFDGEIFIMEVIEFFNFLIVLCIFNVNLILICIGLMFLVIQIIYIGFEVRIGNGKERYRQDSNVLLSF